MVPPFSFIQALTAACRVSTSASIEIPYLAHVKGAMGINFHDSTECISRQVFSWAEKVAGRTIDQRVK